MSAAEPLVIVQPQTGGGEATKVAGIAAGTILAIVFIPLALALIIGIVIWLSVRNHARNILPPQAGICPQGYQSGTVCACPIGACSTACPAGQVCVASQCRTPTPGTCALPNEVNINNQCVDACTGVASLMRRR